MTWNTHVTIGMNSLWLTAFFPVAPEKYLILIPATALAALLPDIEAESAKIHTVGGRILGGFAGDNQSFKYFHHRGIMHSFFAAFVLFLLMLVLFKDASMALTTTAAYMSHPIIDGFNTKGVGYLYPFKLRLYSLVPWSLRTPLKGPVDKLLFILGAFGLILFLLFVAPQLTSLVGTNRIL